jgi:hypothetical protein
MEELNVDNYPMVLLGVLLSEKQYETTDLPVTPGRSVIINTAGKTFLYMGDDPRKGSTQIMAKDIGGYEIHFLPVESKKSIRLLNYKYV